MDLIKTDMKEKESVEQAAKRIYPSTFFDGTTRRDNPNAHQLRITFTLGAEWQKEQTPFSREDMIDFAFYCSKHKGLTKPLFDQWLKERKNL